MKKTLLKLSLLSLSLILCSCGSSAPEENAGQAEEETETAETQPAPSEANVTGSSMMQYISEDTFTASFAEDDNNGHSRTVVRLTNNSPYVLLSPQVTVTLREGVSADDLNALLPEGAKVDANQLEVLRQRVSPDPCAGYLNPSETSEGMAIHVPIEADYDHEYLYGNFPYSPEIADLLEISEISGNLIIGNEVKGLLLNTNAFKADWPEGMPGIPFSSFIQPSDNILLNQIHEEIRDRIVIPEGASLYTCYFRSYDNYYEVVFYDIKEESALSCVDELAGMYPEDALNYTPDYYGSDKEGNTIITQWFSDFQTFEERYHPE